MRDDGVVAWATGFINETTKGEPRKKLISLLEGNFANFKKSASIDVLAITTIYAFQIKGTVAVEDFQSLEEKIFKALKIELTKKSGD